MVRQLQKRGTEVFLVSGGFHELIDPVAKMLSIPVSNVYANRLLYFYDGEFSEISIDRILDINVMDFCSFVIA